MAITSYINGAGGTTGADLAILDRITASGLIYFIGNAVTGASDANSGLDRGKPLLTSAQAYANASASDTIVYLSGHNETISSSVVINKAGLALVGEGTGSAKPILTCGSAITMLDITSDSVLLDNITFGASTVAPTAIVRVNAAAGVSLNALTFSCGANDTGRALSFANTPSYCRLTNSSFTVTAAGAKAAIELQSAMAGLFMDRITFDGGSFEWTSAAFLGTSAVTRLRATRMYMLNGSDSTLATGSTGLWQTEVSTGNSRLTWTV